MSVLEDNQASLDEVSKELSHHSITRMAGEPGSREGRWLCVSRRDSDHSWFEVTAWPGYIVMTGDRGEWVFSRRNTDMIGFFEREGCPSGQNLEYLHEKLQAEDVRSGSQRFSVDAFREAVEYSFHEMEEDEQSEHEDKFDELVESEPETEEQALELLRDADWLYPDDLPSVLEYTPAFIWACRALTWFARHVTT